MKWANTQYSLYNMVKRSKRPKPKPPPPPGCQSDPARNGLSAHHAHAGAPLAPKAVALRPETVSSDATKADTASERKQEGETLL